MFYFYLFIYFYFVSRLYFLNLFLFERCTQISRLRDNKMVLYFIVYCLGTCFNSSFIFTFIIVISLLHFFFINLYKYHYSKVFINVTLGSSWHLGVFLNDRFVAY